MSINRYCSHREISKKEKENCKFSVGILIVVGEVVVVVDKLDLVDRYLNFV